MKQHISKEQCMELTKQQAVVLLDWYLDAFEYLYDNTVVHEYLPDEDMMHHGDFDGEREYEKANYVGKIKNYEGDIRPVLNIGQMIQFLGDDLMHYTKMVTFMDDTANWAVEKILEEVPKYAISVRSWDYLCDALWEAVKLKLKTL
jgi:hypothetical protein